MRSLESDIAIIGGGTAGLAAAVTAAEKQVKVVILEKSSVTGGISNMGSGFFAVESRLQKIKQITLTGEDAFKIYMDFTHWRVNARLVSEFIKHSADTVDWLENMGVKFLDVTSHGAGNFPTQHTVLGPDSGPGIGPGQTGPASAMMEILTRKAADYGAKLLLACSVTQIKKEEKYYTVYAVAGSGEEVVVKTRAAVIATGGSNGILMAREIGAAVIYEPYTKGHPAGVSGLERFYTVTFTFQQPNLLVNLSGERFVNEELVMSGVFLDNAVARQRENTAYMIIDEAIKNYYVIKGFDYAPGGIQVPITGAKGFDEEVTQLRARNNPHLIVADSLEELCRESGVDAEGLCRTLEEYNRMCDSGRDEVFHKKARYLRPVKHPPFYAVKRVAHPVTRKNGIIISYRMEVLDTGEKIIPGLYAAGMDTASNIYYDTYPMIFPGTAMGFALNSGRTAGENAAAFALKNRL